MVRKMMNVNKLSWEYIPEDIADQYRVSADSVFAVGDKADYIVAQAGTGWCCYVLLPFAEDEHYCSFQTMADAKAFAERREV